MGGELGGSVNNYSLKRVDQAFIQIKYINVHRIWNGNVWI